MPTCVQQMLEPYGMGVSRINIRRGLLMIPASLFDWILSLGCNPIAMVDHQTSNEDAAKQMGIPLAEANKMWRVEFTAEPLPCSITGEQNFSVPTGQTVKVGDKGGHARYLPPRGRFNDWFISCQLGALERIEYFVPTPNPEYVPRRGDPVLSLGSVKRMDGQPLAVKALKGYVQTWMSPEAAQANAEALAKVPPPLTPTPTPVVTTVVGGPRMQELPSGTNTIAILKLPRLYNTPPGQEVMCPAPGCRVKHTFPSGGTMRYLAKHDALLLYEWMCFSCRKRFTTTVGATNKKEYRKYLRDGFEAATVTPPVQPGGAGAQRTFPGWCATCARQMDPDKIGPDGVCDTCWIQNGDPADAPATVAPPVAVTPVVVATGPTGLVSDFHCWGCSETYDDPKEEVDNTGFCRDCVATAFTGLVCPEEKCKQELDDESSLPHFTGLDAETDKYDWCCVKCSQCITFDANTAEPSFIGVAALSRVLSMPDSMSTKEQTVIMEEWEIIRELLVEQWRMDNPDVPDEKEMMPVKCPSCRRALGNTTCEMVQREEDGSILFACTHTNEDNTACGTLMLVRAPQAAPPEVCPECRCSNDVVPPDSRGVAYTEMLIHGFHLYVQVYHCNMCTKNYLDMRRSSTKPSLSAEEAHAFR